MSTQLNPVFQNSGFNASDAEVIQANCDSFAAHMKSVLGEDTKVSIHLDRPVPVVNTEAMAGPTVSPLVGVAGDIAAAVAEVQAYGFDFPEAMQIVDLAAQIQEEAN